MFVYILRIVFDYMLRFGVINDDDSHYDSHNYYDVNTI